MFAAIRIKAIVLGCFPLMAACSDPTPVEPVKPPKASVTDSDDQHSVKGEEMRVLMRKLRAMRLEEVAEEIELTGDLQRDVCDVADMAVLLARDAQVIPLIFKDPDMSPESRRMFTNLAAKFRMQALDLSEAADRRDIREVGVKLNAVINTCNECHTAAGKPRLARALHRPLLAGSAP